MKVGLLLGIGVGIRVGVKVVGCRDGMAVGEYVGDIVDGEIVGDFVTGWRVGDIDVGRRVGVTVEVVCSFLFSYEIMISLSFGLKICECDGGAASWIDGIADMYARFPLAVSASFGPNILQPVLPTMVSKSIKHHQITGIATCCFHHRLAKTHCC